MAETEVRSLPCVQDTVGSRSETFVVGDSDPLSRSSPVITIVASSSIDTEHTDESIPYVIIENASEPAPQTSASETSDTLHQCEDCDYSSHNKHYLKQHIDLVHNPERPYKCPFCDYAGKRSHSLREHLVVHTNERPYECKHCNASFRKKGHLTNHIKLHTTQKLIKCSLCSAYLVDQRAFESHLQESHRTNKIFACELCDFAAGDEVEIVKHIQTHDKVFKCSECSFITADVNKLASHADIHIKKVATQTTLPKVSAESSTHVQSQSLVQNVLHSSKTQPPQVVPSPAVAAKSNKSSHPLMIKCTECGFSALDCETMKNHMWTHLKPDAQPQKKVVEKPRDTEKVSQQIKIIEASLPANATYKCTECSFVHKDANVFISHMLTHKVNETVRIETENLPPKPLTKTIVKQEQTFIVAPVSKENTCRNVENAPFTHDQATGRFQCIVCGYTCEYQRTIKAHIWKHSGNKTIDYPMFQNGPLSMYDDIPTPKTSSQTPETSPETSKIILGPSTKPGSSLLLDKAYPISSGPGSSQQSLRSVPETPALVQKPEDGVALSQTIDEKTFDVDKDTASKTPPKTNLVVSTNESTHLVIESDQDVPVVKEETVTTSEAQHCVPPQIGLVISEVKSLKSAAEVESNVRSLSVEGSKPFTTEMEVASESHLEVTTKESLCKTEDESALSSSKLSEKSMNMLSKEEVSVVVETVDTVSSASDFTGMKSQQSSPRVPEQLHLEDLEENTEKLPTSAPTSSDNSPTMVTRARSRLAQQVAKSKSNEQLEKMQMKQLASLKVEVSSEGDSSKTDSLNKGKKPSDEAMTLLSLLKKTPSRVSNLRAASGVGNRTVSADGGSETETDDEHASEDISTEGTSKPKTGICSSLLAVIEQLRERSKSESETEDFVSGKMFQGKRSSRRRSRRESTEDDLNLDSLENMEKIEEDGEMKYRCKLCHYTNSRTLLIKLHMRLHKSKKPFECSLCDFMAGSSEALQEHMIRHCKMRTYPCKLCPSTFNYKSQLRAHMRAHSDKDPLMCHLCDFESGDPVTYRNHLRFHADQCYHKCSICNKLFLTKSELRSHKQEDCYKDQPDSIEDSDATDSDVEMPKEMLINSENLKCSQCDFTTTNVSIFTDHAIKHEESKTLKCELCDFTAVSSRSLKSHMKRHINDQRFVQQPLEQYKCNLCGYVCHHLPSLKSHMWRHASDRNYSYWFTNDVINAAIDYDCRTDGTNTDDPDILEKVLTSEKKILEGLLSNSCGPDGRQPVCWVVFKCCQCGFETVNKAQLNVHMRSHSDIIQHTLEVTHSFGRHVSNKRPSSDITIKPESPACKVLKTQDHG